MRMMINFFEILSLGALILVGGCASPTTHSLDAESNYRLIFSSVKPPEPRILHSHLERYEVSIFGIHSQPHNGNWEFELVASVAWVEAVKAEFVEIPFFKVPQNVPPRPLPSWFTPNPVEFSVWQLRGGSLPAAHLFIEKSPRLKDRIRVFIRRH